jgi:hypothetical protein
MIEAPELVTIGRPLPIRPDLVDHQLRYRDYHIWGRVAVAASIPAAFVDIDAWRVLVAISHKEPWLIGESEISVCYRRCCCCIHRQPE